MLGMAKPRSSFGIFSYPRGFSASWGMEDWFKGHTPFALWASVTEGGQGIGWEKGGPCGRGAKMFRSSARRPGIPGQTVLFLKIIPESGLQVKVWGMKGKRKASNKGGDRRRKEPIPPRFRILPLPKAEGFCYNKWVILKGAVTMNTRQAGGRAAALAKYGMLVGGTAILAFGLYNVHRQSNITEGGVLGLVLFFDHWLGVTPATERNTLEK